MSFLDKIDREFIQRDATKWETLKKNPNISFRIAGESYLICQKPELQEILANANHSDSDTAYCLLTGERHPIERLLQLLKAYGVHRVLGGILSPSTWIHLGHIGNLKVIMRLREKKQVLPIPRH